MAVLLKRGKSCRQIKFHQISKFKDRWYMRDQGQYEYGGFEEGSNVVGFQSISVAHSPAT
jgi:hypothetical protein